jgi:hypothetical protein
MMRYLLLICGEPIETMPTEMDTETAAWVEEMDGRGVRKFGNALSPASTATTVRSVDGEVLLSDGPFTETKEQILGFDLIECADLDEAIEVAAKHPWAKFGPIEVRALWSS